MDAMATLISLLAASVVYPATFLFSITFSLLKLIASPLLHVLWPLYRTFLLVIRVLVKLEPVYTFFGTAVLLGAIAGYMLHCTLQFTYQMLGISAAGKPMRDEPGSRGSQSWEESESDELDLVKFGNGNREQRIAGEKMSSAKYSRWVLQSRDPRKSGVLEEEDDD
ncbi:hypothetical protein PRK78_002329 [Emydomyces testavorans]|uniref:Uncharacterized protein n=1 Tax=Emydomyces testavorans TaxID=2070801 RepID=A0AAF0DE42_9EURO|nr:hypothetical protein PRK78_002329 [Emydomyces testavorans]